MRGGSQAALRASSPDFSAIHIPTASSSIPGKSGRFLSSSSSPSFPSSSSASISPSPSGPSPGILGVGVAGGVGAAGLISLGYHSNREKILAAFFYGSVSISITLFNRAVFAVHRFNFPLTVTTVQIIISLFFIFLFKVCGTFETSTLALRTIKKVLPLTLCWWLYVVSGVTALRYLNVPMYSVLRRATTLVVMVGEFVMFNKKPSISSITSIMTITVGAIIAGVTDLTFNLKGYMCVGVCVISTAAYLILIRILKDKTNLSEMGMLYYNNVLSLPIMVVCLIFSDEISGVKVYPQLRQIRFLFFLLLSSSQAFLLNVAIFRCTTINSPLTTSVTGQIKDIATTILGFSLFGDVIPGKLNTLGVTIGLMGGLWYSAQIYAERFRSSRKGDDAKS